MRANDNKMRFTILNYVELHIWHVCFASASTANKTARKDATNLVTYVMSTFFFINLVRMFDWVT